ncbi:6344_t:CDS:2 [Ambispora gerdemannii]|uniref:6344_t:CDS:1 n=1 Tax=Ambispora gerdemannii TaxID=144530 RepID=A0A9N8Z1Z4_9GLOM|nr:6344_t:CDS:2 [Ambispora gerdemannii]
MAEETITNLANIKHIILVLSGKGGVGKSSITTQLALCLVNSGNKVGVLDIDLTGPSIPRMLGVDEKQVHQASTGWVPVYLDENQQLCCMSIGFLLQNKNDSVIWRGPKKTAMIRQFLTDVCWGELDYLIIDTPPGTSDEHISIAESLKDVKPDGAVIVTTPQAVALADVRKELNFCKKVKLPILGVIENMSGFVCPHCEECTNLFSTGGGEAMAREFEVDFLGRVPIDPSFTLMLEPSSTPESNDFKNTLLAKYPKSNLFQVFSRITDNVVAKPNQMEWRLLHQALVYQAKEGQEKLLNEVKASENATDIDDDVEIDID